MSAKAIIMLEMVYQAVHTPELRAALFADGKKVLNWLKCVSKMNRSLGRYSVELAGQLKEVAPRVGEHFEEYECITPPTAAEHISLPFQSSDGTGEQGSAYKIFESDDREHHLDFTNPVLTWWSLAHSDRDQIMADAPRADLGAYLPGHLQADINSWLEGDRE